MKSQGNSIPSTAAVNEMETAWIPLSDGCRLAARIWLPADAEERPVGAVLEYIPYRRRDLSRMRDEPMGRYFAEHGYASLRVDLRGSGDSSGLLEDEYTQQEWDDGYSNAVFRMMDGLGAPRRATVGPWGHLYPHEGVPGPAVGFLQDALRWWERWLDGVDNGIMDEACCRLWMQEWVRPGPRHSERPGRWVTTVARPGESTRPVTFHLTRGGLRGQAGEEERIETSSPQTASTDLKV